MSSGGVVSKGGERFSVKVGRRARGSVFGKTPILEKGIDGFEGGGIAGVVIRTEKSS